MLVLLVAFVEARLHSFTIIPEGIRRTRQTSRRTDRVCRVAQLNHRLRRIVGRTSSAAVHFAVPFVAFSHANEDAFYCPSLPPGLVEKRKREDEADRNSSDAQHSPSPDDSSKKRRVIGPSMPPAPLDERPSQSPPPAEEQVSDDESSDDDFGPALPTAADAVKKANPQPAPTAPAPAALQRDEWMTMAPTSGDWSSRVDPTQLKARKFNTGKGAKAPPASAGSDDAWHETPEQKQARLQRELMGIQDKAPTGPTSSKQIPSPDNVAASKHSKNHSAVRGPSLFNTHQKKEGREEDDDPSKRAFDREKDIAGGLQLNSTQRRDMVKKASDFGSRFSSSKYL